MRAAMRSVWGVPVLACLVGLTVICLVALVIFPISAP
jgi:hypothetical protein